MTWQEFLATYETHDCSFERMNFDADKKQCRLHLEVQSIYDFENTPMEDNYFSGELAGLDVLQFLVDPEFDFTGNDFNGEILNLSIDTSSLAPEHLKLFIAFLVWNYSPPNHTFHTLEIIAKEFRWIPSDI